MIKYEWCLWCCGDICCCEVLYLKRKRPTNNNEYHLETVWHSQWWTADMPPEDDEVEDLKEEIREQCGQFNLTYPYLEGNRFWYDWKLI